jgi:hypothetical protein
VFVNHLLHWVVAFSLNVKLKGLNIKSNGNTIKKHITKAIADILYGVSGMNLATCFIKNKTFAYEKTPVEKIFLQHKSTSNYFAYFFCRKKSCRNN